MRYRIVERGGKYFAQSSRYGQIWTDIPSTKKRPFFSMASPLDDYEHDTVEQAEKTIRTVTERVVKEIDA